MDALEKKRITAEWKRVDAAKEEQELRIHELQAEIDKLNKSIKISEDRLKELSEKLK
jgi:hypothetical protein